MRHGAKSILAFLGARDFTVSRSFYKDLGFAEVVLSPSLSLFTTDGLGFYLQHAYVQDWGDNTMLFIEVDDVDRHWSELNHLALPTRYAGVSCQPATRRPFLHTRSPVVMR